MGQLGIHQWPRFGVIIAPMPKAHVTQLAIIQRMSDVITIMLQLCSIAYDFSVRLSATSHDQVEDPAASMHPCMMWMHAHHG